MAMTILAFLGTSCSRQSDVPAKPGDESHKSGVDRAVVLKVDGMQRGEGGKT